MKKYIYITLIAITTTLVFCYSKISDSTNNLNLTDLDSQFNKIELPDLKTDPARRACCKI